MTLELNCPQESPLPEDDIEKLADIMESGGVIVYPTNTLYGLGASIFSQPGIRKVYAVKGRPDGIPLSIMATEGQIELLCKITEKTRQFIRSGNIHITAILPALDSAPWLLQHEETLAIRLPTSELLRSVIARTGPITTTSANKHGQDSPSDCGQARSQLGLQVDAYIDSGPVGGTASTLVDFTGTEPKIIREGALSAEEVLKLYG